MNIYWDNGRHGIIVEHTHSSLVLLMSHDIFYNEPNDCYQTKQSSCSTHFSMLGTYSHEAMEENIRGIAETVTIEKQERK